MPPLHNDRLLADKRDRAVDEDQRHPEKVADLDGFRSRKQRESGSRPPNMVTDMPDTPSREEIGARLEAAEARTETMIAQLGATMGARATASDHKIDLLGAKFDVLIGAVSEIKIDSKKTREVIWTVGIGAVIAVLGLVVALWIAGINVQGNMIGIFQAGLGVHAEQRGASVPILPAPPAPTQVPQGKSAGK